MAGVALCVALGFGVVAPAIPLFARQFGVSATAAGAVVSAFALMRFVSGLAAGRLVDAIGQRVGLILGIGVVAVSSLLAGLAQTYPQLLILRGVGGIGSAVFGVGAMSLVLRVAGRRMRGRAVSIYRSGFLIGGIVGPALGGAVLGVSVRAPFFLYAGTLTAAMAVAFVFLTRTQRPAQTDNAAEETMEAEATEAAEATDRGAAAPPSQEAEDSTDPDPSVWTLLRTREYQAALMANLAVGLAILGVRSTAVPFLIVYSLHEPRGWVGAAFVSSAIVQTAVMFPAGRWADSAGRRAALATGAGVAAIGLILLAFGTSLVLTLVAMAVFGAGSAFLGSAPGALVGDVAGRRSGTAVAVFNMANDLGAVTGPILAGWLIDAGSYPAVFGTAAAVVVLAGILGLRLPGGAPHTAATSRS
jgi:MFS family permease